MTAQSYIQVRVGEDDRARILLIFEDAVFVCGEYDDENEAAEQAELFRENLLDCGTNVEFSL